MKKKLLIIGHTWPEPQSTAAGTRMMQLIELFTAAGYAITFASAASPSEYSVDLSAHQVATKAIILNDSSFDHWVKEEAFQAVMYDRFMVEEQFGWRFRESCPNSLNILDTEDLHFLRNARERTFKNNEALSAKHLYSDLAMREIASIYRCDMTLIISKFEMEVLQDQFSIPKSLLYYLPFLIELKELKKLQPENFKAFTQRAHFATIGNFIHKPNYDAVLYLKTELWPLIKKELPQAELHIYGSYESPKVQQLHNENQGFHIKGRVEDATAAIEKHKVLLAPIRFGAGLKGKLFTAMQTGTPFVGTSIAVEGIFSKVDATTHSFDSPDQFAQQAIHLYRNELEWTSQQHIGFKTLEDGFNIEGFKKNFLDQLDKLSEELESHRWNNFMGRLLQKQSYNSTKFFSQWIEVKNKKD